MATVKSSINGVLEKVANTGFQLYLSGKDNFRDKLGTIQVYKGNRDPSMRPHYYQEIKDYILNVWHAELVNGQEADDAVGIAQWAKKDKSTCIVGQDKDLNMIPGWHYNPIKDDMWYQDLASANQFFFFQMLTGDRTDNIPGIKGIGEVRAARLLAPCEKDVFKMRDVVMQEYKKQYGAAAESAYAEVASLLWIRREPEQRCPF